MAVELLVNVDVDDLERGVAFYVEAFGLRVGRRFGDSGSRAAGRSRADLPAGEEAAGTLPFAGATAAARLPAPLDAGPSRLRGRRTSKRRWSSAPSRPVRAARARSASHVWGRMALMSDPFGNGFCLIQFVGRGYDEIASIAS